MKKILLVIAILFSGITSSYASHLMGAEITYIHVGGNNYEVTLAIYRDCDGIPLNLNQSVTFQSASCGLNFAPPMTYRGMTEVSQVCPGEPTTCNGGTTPGTQQYVFMDTITLIPCSDWIIHWNGNARNPAITNLLNPGISNLYIQNTLNNILGTNNNSPQYARLPTPYLCVNQLAIYSHAASDADGDSLYYTFNTPLTTPGPPGTPMIFVNAPPQVYSLLQPMLTTTGMNLDSLTGEMCFTPSQNQTSIVSVLIEEFRNNVLIATSIREMQVIVTSACGTNINPTAGVTPTCGGNGGGMSVTVAGPTVTVVDANSITMCPFDNVCVEYSFSDPNPDDSISVDTTNISASLPGAIITLVGNNTKTPVLTVCWTPTALDSGLNVFSVILTDDACPISGVQSFSYDITVFDEPYAGPDQIICGTQAAQLLASGGATYTWFDAATNIQVPVGPTFSCNPCINPLAFPPVTTDYYVLSSLTASCENTDTVKIIVVPDFTPDAIGDSILCDYYSTPLGVNITAGPTTGTYTYLWNNGATLSPIGGDTLSNPIATPLVSTWYVVEVTSPDGCKKTVDSVHVQVVPPANVVLVPGNTIMCLGDTLSFDIINVPLNPVYTYSWAPPANLTNAAIADPKYIPIAAGTTTFTVTLTDAVSNCSFDRTQDVTVNSNTLLAPTLTNAWFCEGSATTIDAGTGFLSYEWTPSGGFTQIGAFNQPGNYAVIVSDGVCSATSNFIPITERPLPHPTILGQPSFCASDVFTTMYINNGGIYNGIPSWSTGTNGDSTTTGPNPALTVTVDSNGCIGSSSIPVISIANPFTTITGNDSICPGGNTTLSAGGPFAGYLWSPSNSINQTINTGAGSVSVLVYDQDGCSYTTTSIVYNYPAPVADFTINPEISGEPNQDIIFTDASTGASSWIWNFDVTSVGSIPLNETGPGPFTFIYDKQGKYTMTLSVANQYGCTNSIEKEYLIFSDVRTQNVITPNGDGINDKFVFENLDTSLFPNKLTVQNRWGSKVYEQDNYNNDWGGDNLSEGTYFYVLTIDFNTGAEVYKGTLSILK